MSVTDLIPRKRNRDIAVTRAPALSTESRDPFVTLHREVNRLLDSMWNSFNFTGKFKASFRNGVLTVILPKSLEAQVVRRIPLQTS